MLTLFAAACLSQSTLTADLTRILSDAALSRASVSVLVKEFDGQVVFDFGADKRLIPASNQKIITTAACFDAVGPAAKLETFYWRNGEDGYLLGGWDPLLTLEELLTIRENIGPIKRLFFWDAYDEDDPVNGDWQRDDASNEDAAPITALTVNRGRAELFQENGRLVLKPRNFGMVVKRESPAGALRIRRGDGSWTVRVWGKLPEGDARLGTVSLPDPALCAARIVHTNAERRRIGKDNNAKSFAPRMLADVAMTVMKESNNHAADTMLRMLGAKRGNSAWQESSKSVTAFLSKLGVSPESVRIADGSGLSRFNELTARSLVTTMEWMLRSEKGASFQAVFARPGEGTLAGRLGELDVWAKTGTMTGVSSLSGWIDVTVTPQRDGPKLESFGTKRRLLFAIIFNHYPGRAADVRPIQDAFVRRLSQGG